MVTLLTCILEVLGLNIDWTPTIFEVFVVFLGSSRQIFEQYLKIVYG
jgi:hypothetical protein